MPITSNFPAPNPLTIPRFHGFVALTYWPALALCVAMCRLLHMATNLAINDQLLEEALRMGGQRTKKDTVTQALEEYVQRRKQARILELFGKVDFDPKYDYKRQRRRR